MWWYLFYHELHLGMISNCECQSGLGWTCMYVAIMNIIVMGHHTRLNIQSALTFTARNISNYRHHFIFTIAATLVTINYQKPDCSFCDEILLEQNYNLKPLWIEIGNKNQSEEAFEFTWTWYYLYELWLTIYFTGLPNDTHWIFVLNSSYLYKKPKDPWFMKGFNFL